MTDGTKRSFRRIVLASLLLCGAFTIVAVRWYYLRESQALDTYIASALSVIADTKAREVGDWRSARLGDGDVLTSTLVTQLAQRVLNQRTSTPADRLALLDVLQRTITAFRYAGVALVDRQGRVLLEIGAMNADQAHLRHLADAASLSGGVTLSDLSAGNDGRPWMSLAAPAGDVGAIILGIDPATFLYPYLRTWPAASRSGETLLLRREGVQVVYLSEGRHGRGLTFHGRSAPPGLPLSAPAPGAGRLAKWSDYQGGPVLGVVQEVPGSPWYLVAKVDSAEVNAPLRRLGWEMAVLAILMLAGNGAAAGMIWRGRQIRVYEDRESWFRQVADETPALLWTLAADMQHPFINRELARFLGSDSNRLDNDWAKYIHPDDRQRVLATLERHMSEGREYRDEFRVLQTDGEARWVEVHALPKRGLNGTFGGYTGSLIDVTEQHDAQLHLRDANAALALELLERTRSEREVQALTARLIHAQEAERAHLARELHDDLSQQLAAVCIATSNLKKKIPVGADEAVVQSSRIQQKLVHMAECIRRLSHQLHPSALQHSGLAPALRNYCEEYGSLTSHRIIFRCDTFCASVPPTVELCVYRVLQEALQNAVKHSRVKEAKVELEYGEWGVRLTVSDHGVGIDPEAPPSDGLGLVSIKERTRLVNGSVEVRSRHDHGTVLTLTIPLPEPSRNETGHEDVAPNPIHV